jgi:hypothetical protein
LCEAYAEKRGYRTDRRGRPDHQRAGSELVRDTVDGILPLFFLPPDYKGKDVTPSSIAQYCQEEEAALKTDAQEDCDAGADHEEEESSEEEEATDRRKEQQSAPVNAFSLLDSDSSDEDSDED